MSVAVTIVVHDTHSYNIVVFAHYCQHYGHKTTWWAAEFAWPCRRRQYFCLGNITVARSKKMLIIPTMSIISNWGNLKKAGKYAYLSRSTTQSTHDKRNILKDLENMCWDFGISWRSWVKMICLLFQGFHCWLL